MPETSRKHRPKADQLLRTKLVPPRLPAPLVPRPALLARLDEGMARPMTLVAAPTGYGKTTLVAQWLGTRREPSAWVSLDPGDDDPAHFWTYVITACRTFDPGLGKPALAALRSSRLPSLDALVVSLLNDLAAAPTAGILVLEDYHAISSPQVHAGVAYLIDRLPATLHLVLITRAEPPLSLGRLRAHNQVSEIGAADLQFTPEETRAFLEQVVQVPLKPETAARLDARIEGWAAGLRLAALALDGQHDPAAIERFLGSFSGGHRHVTEYLAGEVLDAQPEPLQEFLLRTSILDRLAGGLCDALTGRSDGAGTLELLERAGLFVLPLGDDAGETWYRYHALFAEAMRKVARERFGEEELRALYLRASAWHEEHGRLDQAIEAALAAQGYPHAAALIEQGLDWRGHREVHAVRRWIEQLPPEALGAHPALCFEYAVAVLFTSDRYAATTAARLEAPLSMAESAWRGAEDGASLGQALALRALVALWQDELERAFALARGSLGLLPESDAFWRGSDLIIAGIEELLAGRPGAAQAALIEARALSGAAGSLQGQLAATGLLGDACVRQGEFDQALELYAQVQAEAAGGEDMLDDQAAAALGRGAIAYESNDLEAAEREAASALELGTRRGNDQVAVHAALLLARVSQARGETQLAQQRTRALAAQIQQPGLRREVLAWQARLACAAGDSEAVHHWYAGIALGAPAQQASLQELEDLVAARMLLADGESAAALALLERRRTDARQHGRTSSEVEALALTALACAAGAGKVAGDALGRALAIAGPKGYQRVFLDEGEPMRRAIASWGAHVAEGAPRLRAYIYRLLAAFSNDQARGAAKPAIGQARPAAPFEPLSPQERRVLRLLAAGLSNPEIARELVVSTNTIKTQLQSIYRKLNVTSRAEAGEVARELKLV